MKDTNTNSGNFAMAKLRAKGYRLLTIALVAVIGLLMMACPDSLTGDNLTDNLTDNREPNQKEKEEEKEGEKEQGQNPFTGEWEGNVISSTYESFGEVPIDLTITKEGWFLEAMGQSGEGTYTRNGNVLTILYYDEPMGTCTLNAAGELLIEVTDESFGTVTGTLRRKTSETPETPVTPPETPVTPPETPETPVTPPPIDIPEVIENLETLKGEWTGLITEVETAVTLTVNDSEWTMSVPLANTNEFGTYTYSASDGTAIFMREDAVFATGTSSAADKSLTLTLITAVLGASTVTLNNGTVEQPLDEIEYLYSGIWTDTGTPPVITYISGDKWTFSLPYEGKQANGTFLVYGRKAAFYKTDGTFFAVAKVATEQAELTGNTLTVYPVTGGAFALTLNPHPIPYVGNWQGGAGIGGTLYVGITTWTLEDANDNVLAAGEYVWDGNEAYFISNGARFATGTINETQDALTVAVNNSVPVFGGLEQVFTLIQSPFIGNWKGSVMLIVTVNAAVTGNTYAITSIAGNVNGQYIWRTVDGATMGYFYSNGYSYGVANLTTPTRIVVTLDEPIRYSSLTVSTITVNKQ